MFKMDIFNPEMYYVQTWNVLKIIKFLKCMGKIMKMSTSIQVYLKYLYLCSAFKYLFGLKFHFANVISI